MPIQDDNMDVPERPAREQHYLKFIEDEWKGNPVRRWVSYAFKYVEARPNPLEWYRVERRLESLLAPYVPGATEDELRSAAEQAGKTVSAEFAQERERCHGSVEKMLAIMNRDENRGLVKVKDPLVASAPTATIQTRPPEQAVLDHIVE